MIPRAKLVPVLLGGGVDIGAGLKTSLMAWWTLDETSAGAAPVTRNDSHGTNHLTDTNTTPSGTGIKSNGADCEFNNSEFLTINDNAALSMGDIDFTICAWANFEAAPPNTQGRPFVSKYLLTGNQREYALLWERLDASTTNHIEFVLSSNGTATTTQKATTLGLPSISTWYFVVAWHDATANTINIQVNNGTVDSTSYSGGVFNSSAAFQIGGLGSTAGYYMDGIVDEVAIWKRVLTAAERTWLYNDGNGRTYANLA